MTRVLPFRLRTEDELLALIPSLPRPVLARLTSSLIDRMDELDGDPDLEDSETGSGWIDARGRWCGPGPAPDGPWHEDDEDGDEDCCAAGDDRVMSGAVLANGINDLWLVGDDDDAENDERLARLPHRRRIQRTRCLPRTCRNWRTGAREILGYKFRKEPIAPSLKNWRRRDPRLRTRRNRR